MTRLILAAALSALTLAAPARATDLGAMTDAERQAFRDEVRAYLLENPEVLVDAMDVLQQRQADQQAAGDASLVQSNADSIFHDNHSWVGGNPEGDVTLVEFMDYRCTYCRKSYSEVEELVKSDGNIRFVVKEFPILGEQSELSARFAIATLQMAGDEVYKKAHDTLITFRGKVTKPNLSQLAGKLGLDAEKVLARMDSPEVDKVISQNMALAQRLQISGTPTFVLEDQMLRGYVPLDGMRQIVGEVRAD